MTISPARQRLLLVGALLLWSVSLVLFRMHASGGKNGWGLLWNLFLAAIPLLWSAAFASAIGRKQPVWATICFALWILFLPNAPYLLTDVIHLSPRSGVPLWYVLAMLLSCAATGTLLGYMSLMEVHATIEKTRGAWAAWPVAVLALMSCGFGIYLGRFLRWNSWDALTHPLQFVHTVIGQFVDAGPHPHPIPVTLIYGGGLVIGYVALRVLAATERAGS